MFSKRLGGGTYIILRKSGCLALDPHQACRLTDGSISLYTTAGEHCAEWRHRHGLHICIPEQCGDLLMGFALFLGFFLPVLPRPSHCVDGSSQLGSGSLLGRTRNRTIGRGGFPSAILFHASVPSVRHWIGHDVGRCFLRGGRAYPFTEKVMASKRDNIKGRDASLPGEGWEDTYCDRLRCWWRDGVAP